MRTQPFRPQAAHSKQQFPTYNYKSDRRDVHNPVCSRNALQVQRRDIGLGALQFVEAAAEVQCERCALVTQE